MKTRSFDLTEEQIKELEEILDKSRGNKAEAPNKKG